jgi:phage-related protein
LYIYTIQTKELSSGGTIDTSNSSSAYPLVEIETISGMLDSGSVTINPNTFYVLRGNDNIGSTGQIEIRLGEATTGVANEYLF